MIKYIFAFAIIGIFATFITTNSQSYQIDVNSSKLEWEGKKVVMGKHYGTVAIKKGSINMTDKNLSGSFDIDMTKIVVLDLKEAETNAKLKGHLESDDFFSVAKHTTASFVITKSEQIKGSKSDNFKISGELTIKELPTKLLFLQR